MDLSKNTVAEFNPRSPEYRLKLWLRLVGPNGTTQLYLFWRRIALALLLLAVASWLAAAAAVSTFIRQQHGFTGISYLNIVWPPHWPRHREALGRHLIARGRQELADGRIVDATRLLAAGVARAPGDVAARRQLAVLLIRLGNLHGGLAALTSGIDLARDNLDYLKLTFGLLFELRQDREAEKLAGRFLPGTADERLTHQFLALQLATARYHLGDYDGAEQVVRLWRLSRSVEGTVLLARCDWERGYPELAVGRLEEARRQFPTRDEIPVQLIRLQRDLGRHDLAYREALVRYAADPLSPGPRIDLLYARQHSGGRPAPADVDRYLRDYDRDPAALLLLGWFAADTGDSTLARQVLTQLQANGFPTDGADLALVQALIANGEYAAALTEAETALRDKPAGGPFSSVLAGLRALACFGLGQSADGELYLQAFAAATNLRATDAVILSGQLTRIGALPQARRVLAAAATRDPRNQAAIAGLVSLLAQTGDVAALEQYLPHLLSVRKPSRAALQAALLSLSDSTPGRAQLRRDLEAAIARTTATPAPDA